MVPSAMNSRYTFGGVSSLGSTTIPFRTSFRLTRLSAKEADWPAAHIGTGMRFRSMDRMLVVVNWPRPSGPMRTVSPAWITPIVGDESIKFIGKLRESMRTAFDNTRDNSTDKGNGEGIVHVEFKRRLSIVVAVMREDIQECPYQVEALASNIGNLEDGAYSLADKLCCGLDGLVTVLDKDGNLLCAR